MSDSTTQRVWADILIVAVSVIILSGSLWVWLAAAPISREAVFLATTIALIISLVLVVNVAILILLRLQRRISHLERTISSSSSGAQIPSEQVIVVTLNNTERRIINRLEENGGEMAQDELRRTTGLSKSTLSVALSALERKSLVVRVAYGKTKIVRLRSNLRR
ncbi:MAG: helix-turn-helix transcriptional regulator [Candidatus Thorarchaeota archaeon]